MSSSESDCVQVAVRVRPLIKSEKERGCREIVEKVPNESQVIVRNTDSFTFNYVFGQNDTQDLLYQRAVKGNLIKLFMGYNLTVLAYGQTGSGKTHTMGTTFDGVLNEDIGVIPRAIYDIFKEVENMSPDYSFHVTCSFMELYQEQLYDLLTNSSRDQSVVDIREDSSRGIVIPGLTECVVKSSEEVIDCLMRGSSGRAVGATAMNAQSSRSHAIFTVTIQKTKNDDPNMSVTSKFHLVDLAGSERSKKTKATGDRFKEGVKINQGLLALGNVISALGSKSQSLAPVYVGYRDSKLTRLLQDSLGGNSITLMIACISPADYNLDETLSTLRYADRAKKIKNKPIINQDPKIAEIKRLNAIIDKLRIDLLAAQDGCDLNRTASQVFGKNLVEVQNDVDQLKSQNYELQKQLELVLHDVADVEMRATLAETAKDDFKQKLYELRAIIIELGENLDPEKCEIHYENIKKLLESIGNVEQVIQMNQDKLDDQKSLYSQNNSSIDLYNTIEHDEFHQANNEIKQKFHAFANKQLNFKSELRNIDRQLTLKEELHQKIVANLANFCNYEDVKEHHNNLETKQISTLPAEAKLKEYEQKLKQLEMERDEIQLNLTTKANNVSAKLSEERRKRLNVLESEIAQLKKKNLQQEKLLKMREKEKQKIQSLGVEIREMKAARVKLIREMRSESERFKQWKMIKEKEILQLKAKDRKRENEMVKMKVLHDKQKNVLKRKMEEAVAVNKRLRDALDRTKAVQSQRKLLNSGKAEQLIAWVDQELEVILSVTDAEFSLEHLMEDRAILTSRLNELNKFDPQNQTEINGIEEEINMRNAQISDLQQKILDTNIDLKINTFADSLQSINDARSTIKRLFSALSELRRENRVQENKFEDYKVACEDKMGKLEELEKQLQENVAKHNEEKAKIERSYEEKITILLKELNNQCFENGELTPEVEARMQIQEETLDNYEKLQKKYDELLYEFEQQKLKKSRKMPIVNKRLEELKEIAVELSDTSITEEDNTSDDPDWVKTPVYRRRTTSSHVNSQLQNMTRQNLSKRPSDNLQKCQCKTSCTNRCSCKKNNRICSNLCKCSSHCQNQIIIKEEQEEEENAHETDTQSEKENLSNKTDDDDDDDETHSTPKKSKLSTTFAADVTPSYPYSMKKRRPYYDN